MKRRAPKGARLFSGWTPNARFLTRTGLAAAWGSGKGLSDIKYGSGTRPLTTAGSDPMSADTKQYRTFDFQTLGTERTLALESIPFLIYPGDYVEIIPCSRKPVNAKVKAQKKILFLQSLFETGFTWGYQLWQIPVFNTPTKRTFSYQWELHLTFTISQDFTPASN